MQVPLINTLTHNDNINTFMKRLELWKGSLERNTFDMFPTFERCRPSNETEANKEGSIHHPFGCFAYLFKEVDVSKFELVISPFYAHVSSPPRPYRLGGPPSFLFKGYRRLRDHSPSSTAEVKNVWSFTSTPRYVFMEWCLNTGYVFIVLCLVRHMIGLRSVVLS
jgi:hypothetical protein